MNIRRCTKMSITIHHYMLLTSICIQYILLVSNTFHLYLSHLCFFIPSPLSLIYLTLRFYPIPIHTYILSVSNPSTSINIFFQFLSPCILLSSTFLCNTINNSYPCKNIFTGVVESLFKLHFTYV